MYVVILAGGSGTRFWPLSRKTRPKQLISVLDGPTMLQRTVERILPLQPKRVLVVTNRLQAAETEQQLARYRSLVPVDVIAEPVGRNTAPAVGLAAAIIAAHDPEGIMAVLPADHYIRDDQGLCRVLANAAQTARNGWLVTLGIVPTAPETGYGYLEADTSLRGDGPFPVSRFVEKPDHATALSYLESGRFFWNSGMFVWRADTILAEIGRHMPELAERLDTLDFSGDVWELSDLDGQIAGIYGAIGGQSIDYGVMERSDRVQMWPADIGWSDLGSWSALPEVLEMDDNGAVAVNSLAHLAIDSSGCIVSGNGGVVATIGVDNLVVVSTGDAVLVCPRERAQEVRQVVEELERRKMTQYL
ncbi:mannose-1-phosphate guanylyltransferase [Trichlorobacter ammonificans]|uniref:mannose-1-phosphate guanylyltransferase n=1 Tax=Trichlorobacter ammonificans TaxID=2916410 RepID=UPI0027378B70|nr:mannose-1-phosphate guanylyltransferase [Trichlorobacter ammonificans]